MKIEAYIRQRNRAVEQAVKLAESRGHIDTFLAKDVYLYLEDTLAYVNELDEAKKPVIPQFVADHIEKYKDNGLSIHGWFSFKPEESNVEGWIYNNGSFEESKKREFLLIDAVRNGYKVEKERKYYVLNHKGATMLVKNMSGAIECSNWYALKSIRAQYLEKYQLTETEIKALDERYWAFAEPVEEVTG